MEKIFESIIKNSEITMGAFLGCLGAALIIGFILAWLCYFHTDSSKGFFITISILPMIVTMIILLVNGNIGAGVAVAGAFALIRFRSAPGTAKEIAIIFIDMACGLAFGMGYVAYGLFFGILAGVVLLALEKLNLWDKKNKTKQRILKVTMPEDLNYPEVLEDVLSKYTKRYELIKVKTINMGSMFRITYRIELNNSLEEKMFIDDIRLCNGNLEVSCEKYDSERIEL